MTAPAHATAIAFLRRAGLLTAVLALIAGIFGMHVMTATHAAHSPATAAATVSAHHDSSPAGGHAGEHPPGPSSAPDDARGTGRSGCPDRAVHGLEHLHQHAVHDLGLHPVGEDGLPDRTAARHRNHRLEHQRGDAEHD